MSSSRRNFLFSCLTLALAFAAILVAPSAQVHAKRAANETRIEGTLVAKNVAKSQLRIRQRGGVIVNVVVPATAKVERNNLHSNIGAFKVGDFVQVRSVNGTVTKAEAVGP